MLDALVRVAFLVVLYCLISHSSHVVTLSYESVIRSQQQKNNIGCRKREIKTTQNITSTQLQSSQCF